MKRQFGRIVGLFAFSCVVLSAATANAQNADTILINGKITTLAEPGTVEALAVRDGKVAAVGTTAQIRALAGPSTRTVDLEGRAVIPGLIDSHMHAIRAALFYATEVNWIGTKSITEAMQRIRAAAQRAKPGQWIIVAGGWTEQQFKEKRIPTQAELLQVAPDHPVYIQLFYNQALLTPAGLKALNINSDADVPPNGKLERDANGALTGWVLGGNPAISNLFDKLPLPTLEESVDGTRQFFRELNRLGITGVGDPGGFNMTAASYQPLMRVWQDKQLTVRVRYSLFAQSRGKELDDYRNLTQMLPMGFGDDMLRFNGLGENVTWGVYNNDNPTPEQKEQYYQVLKWAVARGMTVTQHWNNNRSAHHLLEVLERVNKETPIAPLRWSIAHMNDATPENLARMKALGVGWLMQNAMYFGGEAFLKARGNEVMRLTPPIMTAVKMNLIIGGGTDAHRVMSYNPFNSLQWMLDGKTVAGMPTRAPEEIPSREQALRFYTLGSAWFTHEDEKRGSLAVGRDADLAVLTEDYMTIPVEKIGDLEALLTMVGGKIVYATGPFARLEQASR